MFWDSDLYRRKIWYSGVLRYLRCCSYTRYSLGKWNCMVAAALKVKCHKKVIHGTHLSYCIWFITINILNKTLPSMKTENLLGYLWESCVLWGNPRDMSRLSFKAVRSRMYHHCVLEQAKCYVNILSLITYYRPICRRWKLNRWLKSITFVELFPTTDKTLLQCLQKACLQTKLIVLIWHRLGFACSCM